MSVKSRLKELNKRLAQKLTSKGVQAEETETTTQLINKVDEANFVSEITDFSNFFRGNTRKDLLSKLNYNDTSKGIKFNDMFNYSNALTTIPLFDTSNGTNFMNMFVNCNKLVNVPLFNTSNGTSFTAMFQNCSKLTTIPAINTSKSTSFITMFDGCTSLITISALDTSKGTNFMYMFNQCTSLVNLTLTGTIHVSGFDVSPCIKLSKASITSVINALSSTATGKSVKLSLTAVNTAFETSSGAGDGSTSEEWTTLIATKSNWTISLS